MNGIDHHFDEMTIAARLLASIRVDSLERVGGGRNNRINRVRCAGGSYALKQYPSRQDDPRARLATEVAALKLMERYGIDVVPRVVAVDRERGFALLSWIEGAAVAEVGDADVDAAVAFLSAIHALRQVPRAAEQPQAAEACLSGKEIERQIRERLARLAMLPAEEQDLHDFLEDSFVPAFNRLFAEAKAGMQTAGLEFAADVTREFRSLVPADFGFHNSLRRRDGSLAFVDFEYFGWDDPVKLTADILLHPGMSLPAAQRLRFRRAAERLYGEDPTFSRRLAIYFPLFGLRWALILLNEFIPELWRRRVLAGASDSWSEAKLRQLKRAQDMLASLSHWVEDEPMAGKALVAQPLAAVTAPLDERSKYLRRLIVRALAGGERGHIGSSMSLVEILRVLYDDVMRYRPAEPKWLQRDRMILSKGHGCLALYVMLADKGFIPVETLDTFCHRDSILGGHPEAAKVPGVEASTGALGHGLSYGVGMALAARIQGRDSRVFVVMGDGEINEGSVWEAAMCAGKHKLANLAAIVDYNKIQSAGPTREIQDLEPLLDKWRAFNFATVDVDGHDVAALRALFRRLPLAADRPSAIICHTVKGKGIPFAENDPNWHHKSKVPADMVAKMRAALV